MATLRNEIPNLLKARRLSISDLQRMTQMSYPATHNIATLKIVTDETRVGTLRKVAEALEVQIGDLVTVEFKEAGN